MAGEHMKPNYLALNPLHTVPTLDDNGFVLSESRAIMSYLVDAHSTREELYPKDHKTRAKIDNYLYFEATTLTARVLAVAGPIMFGGEKQVPQDKKTKLYDAFEYLNDELKGRQWIADTPNYTIADISIGTIMSSILESGADISHLDYLSGWYARCGNTIPHWEENIKGAQMFASRVLSNIEGSLKHDQ